MIYNTFDECMDAMLKRAAAGNCDFYQQILQKIY